jgi:hypothetical protein
MALLKNGLIEPSILIGVEMDSVLKQAADCIAEEEDLPAGSHIHTPSPVKKKRGKPFADFNHIPSSPTEPDDDHEDTIARSLHHLGMPIPVVPLPFHSSKDVEQSVESIQ